MQVLGTGAVRARTFFVADGFRPVPALPGDPIRIAANGLGRSASPAHRGATRVALHVLLHVLRSVGELLDVFSAAECSPMRANAGVTKRPLCYANRDRGQAVNSGQGTAWQSLMSAHQLGVPIATEKKTTNLVCGPGSTAISLLETRLRWAESRNRIREWLSRIKIPQNLACAT